MLAFTRNIGDRLLGALVPQKSASASCSPDPWCQTYDTFHNCMEMCHYNGQCQGICTWMADGQ